MLTRSRSVMGSKTMGRDPVRYVSTTQKLRILRRDGYACTYCGSDLGLEEAVIDHVQPWSKGGKTEDSNLVSACRPCNKAKGNRNVEGMG